MSRWQELGLTPDEAQDEINELTQETHDLRRERDKAMAEVARLRAALEEITGSALTWEDADRIARAALEVKP